MTPASSHLDVSCVGRTITLSGDLDSYTAPRLAESLTDLGPESDITLEMAGVAFVDSSGLRVVIEAHKNHNEAGTKLVLKALSSAVLRVVEITGLTEHLNISD